MHATLGSPRIVQHGQEVCFETRSTTKHSLPPGAEIDWLRGMARAPETWELQVAPQDILLWDAERDSRFDLDATD